MATRKGTRNITKNHSFECFGWIEWTRLIAKRANIICKSKASAPKGGSSDDRSVRGNTQKDTNITKKHSFECFGWIEWTRTTDPHLIRVVL